MTQRARPGSDVSAGSWTSAPLYDKIDEATASDTDAITSTNVRLANDTCEVALGSITDPQASTGHIVSLRAKYATNGSRVGQLVARLRQGTTTIASATLSALTTAYADYTFTLTAGEADAITDYGALRLQFEASMKAGGSGTSCTVSVSWAEMAAPDAPAGATGAAAITLGAAAGAGAGTVAVRGAAGVTLGGLTVGATGAVALAGAAAVMLSAATGAGAGGVTVRGAAMLALDAAALAGTGEARAAGAATLTLTGLLIVAAGRVWVAQMTPETRRMTIPADGRAWTVGADGRTRSLGADDRAWRVA